MKKTLLELTYDILNDMDSDEVNSIGDTIESMQVAQIIRTAYEDIISTRNWPHLHRLIKFTASNDDEKPTHMATPENLKELGNVVRYNKQKVGETRRRYEEVTYLSPEAFLSLTNSRNNDNDNVDLVEDYTGVELLIINDTQPTYWTSFDDENIVFDSYDSSVDDTLQANKIQAYGYMEPEWRHEDSFVPDLPSEAFPQLLSSAKSTAFLVIKQMANEKAEQKAQRTARRMARKAWTVKGGIKSGNYGRRSRRRENYSPQKLDKTQVVN